MHNLSSVIDGEMMVRLEAKVGELYCADLKSKTVKEDLETRVAAEGSRILGSWSELSRWCNTLYVVRLDMADIRQDAEDPEAAARTDL